MPELDLPPSPLNSRFTLTPFPVATPGKCAVCGAVDRHVVDFGMTIQFYGAVVFCVTCLTEAAAIIQMVPLADLSAAEEGLTQSFEENLVTRNLVAFTREQYDTLIVAISNIPSLILPSGTCNNAVVAKPATKTDAGIFNFDVLTESESNSLIGQSDDAPVGKGSISLSSSSSDGISNFKL